jgi:inorganic triphosphatase YgiF
MSREEDNVVVRSRTRPAADAALHADSPVGQRLLALLEDTEATPDERFRTDVWRTTHTVRAPGGTVELAFDDGVVASGGSELPICELEVELKSGDPRAVIATARRWAARHGLWLDTATKAQRGVMLSKGVTTLPVSKAPTPALDKSMSVDAALREMTRACLLQILGNTSAIAAGLAGHEHVHQARVGIRKLRTVLREFGPLCPDVDPDWADDLADVFAVLGAARDREVVLADWLARLDKVGAPKLEVPAPVAEVDPVDVLRGVDFTTLALDLMEYAHGTPMDSDTNLVREVSSHLSKLRKGSVKRADRFERLDTEDQHRVRKELKRLRYVAELTATLFSAKKVARFVAAMEPAQDALGELNDLIVATELFRGMATVESEAWFAVGWLSSRLERTVHRCTKPLQRAERSHPYWKH